MRVDMLTLKHSCLCSTVYSEDTMVDFTIHLYPDIPGHSWGNLNVEIVTADSQYGRLQEKDFLNINSVEEQLLFLSLDSLEEPFDL